MSQERSEGSLYEGNRAYAGRAQVCEGVALERKVRLERIKVDRRVAPL